MMRASKLLFALLAALAPALCAAQDAPKPGAAAPAPPELVQFAAALPQQPGYAKPPATRSGLPTLFTIGLTYALANAKLRESLPQLAQAYRKEADAGDPVAQASLGRMYSVGAGVPESSEEAYKWMRKAVENGDAGAMVNLANMYLMGTGVDRDVSEAVRWYERAADAGDPMAMMNLGILHTTGPGVRHDLEEAARLFRKGAELGEPYSALDLGNAYGLGLGVAADPSRSEDWLRKAAAIWKDLDARYKLPLPERARRSFVQAEAAIKEKKFPEAAQLLRNVVTLAPWSPLGWYDRALVQAEVGEFAQAIVDMHMFLNLAPDAPQARGAQDLIYEWERKVKK